MSKDEITKNCRKCGAELCIGVNWAKSHVKKNNKICKSCMCAVSIKWAIDNKERANEIARNYYYTHGSMSMSENKECSQYLGIHVAERILSKMFKDVEVMPTHNEGYDFICNKGKKIDVKAACLRKDGVWHFNIRRNTIADYFLCIAFDNRKDLNPLHLWLVPGNEINHLTGTSITESTLNKWSEYGLEIGKVVECCNSMKE